MSVQTLDSSSCIGDSGETAFRIHQRNVKRARLHNGEVYSWNKEARRFDVSSVISNI